MQHWGRIRGRESRMWMWEVIYELLRVCRALHHYFILQALSIMIKDTQYKSSLRIQISTRRYVCTWGECVFDWKWLDWEADNSMSVRLNRMVLKYDINMIIDIRSLLVHGQIPNRIANILGGDVLRRIHNAGCRKIVHNPIMVILTFDG